MYVRDEMPCYSSCSFRFFCIFGRPPLNFLVQAEGEEEAGAGEEDCGAEFKPLVELQEVETVSGEEEENVLADL